MKREEETKKGRKHVCGMQKGKSANMESSANTNTRGCVDL